MGIQSVRFKSRNTSLFSRRVASRGGVFFFRRFYHRHERKVQYRTILFFTMALFSSCYFVRLRFHHTAQRKRASSHMTSISRVINPSLSVRRRAYDGEGRRCGAARRAFTTSPSVRGLGDVKGRLLLHVHHHLGMSICCPSTSSRLHRSRREQTLARAEPTTHSFNALLLQGASFFWHCIRDTFVVVVLVVLVVPFFI